MAPPEFEVRSGEVVVRFYPLGYVPPRRVEHALTPLQQELLEVIARLQTASLGAIRAALREDVPERTVQDNLRSLKDLHLVEGTGRGRGARWSVVARQP